MTNSVPSNIAGAAIGLSQSVVQIARAVATLGTATIFGWSQGWNMFFPFNTQFVFVMIAGLCVIGIITIKLSLDKSVEKREKAEVELPLIEKKQ